MKKRGGNWKPINWKVEEIKNGWIAKSGTGITIFADDRRKLFAWMKGKDFAGDTSEE